MRTPRAYCAPQVLLCLLPLLSIVACSDSGPAEGELNASAKRRDAGGNAGGDAASDAAGVAARDATDTDVPVSVPLDAQGPADVAIGPVADASSDVFTDTSPDPSPEAGSDGRSVDASEAGAPDGGATIPRRDHVQLWLRADEGIECAPEVTPDAGADAVDRIVRWVDSSGKGRDAIPGAGNHGPRCGDTIPKLNGLPVAAYGTASAADPRESLDLDLSFLVDHGFTIAVVERRREAKRYSNFFLGSGLLFSQTACGNNANKAQGILFGYQSGTKLVGTLWGKCSAILAVPDAPGKGTVDVLVHEKGTENLVASSGLNGNSIASSGEPDLTSIRHGVLGRGWPAADATGDTTFHGDIAEVLLYDVALSADEQEALKAYLNKKWNF